MQGRILERETGIEPASSAWKAEVLPLNYSRPARFANYRKLVEGEGFEPSKAEPSDLQSDPFDRSGTPPVQTADYRTRRPTLSIVGHWGDGAGTRVRTRDPLITNQVLYQLSYTGRNRRDAT